MQNIHTKYSCGLDGFFVLRDITSVISLVYNKILDTAFLQTYEVVDSLTFLKG